MRPQKLNKKINLHKLVIVTMFTFIYCISSGAEVISRYGLEVKSLLKRSSLHSLNRSGELQVKRAIERADGHRIPKESQLKNVVVHAKVSGRSGTVALEVNRLVVDEERFSYIKPQCVPVEKTEEQENEESHRRHRGNDKEELDCIEQPLTIQKMSLYNSGPMAKGSWVLLTSADLDVLLVEVDAHIPLSYQVSRTSLGPRRKADKILSSSKIFRIAPASLDSVAVKASKENITVQSVVIWFDDGSKKNINMYGKISKNRVKTQNVLQPFKKVVAIEVSATSRKLFGSRGYFEVFADKIVTPIQ